MNAEKGKKGFVARPLLVRLNDKIEKTDHCWLWKGATTGRVHAYGVIWNDGKNRLVHRIMYSLYKNNIDDGKEIDHLCKNKLCVNPDHLESVSHQENMLRADPGQRWRQKTHCPKGHEYTPTNTRITHGSRSCKACESIYNKRRWAESKARTALMAVEEGR